MTAKVLSLKEREPSELEREIHAAMSALQGEIDVVCFAIHALEERPYETLREAAARMTAHAFMDSMGRRLLDLRDKLYAIEKLA